VAYLVFRREIPVGVDRKEVLLEIVELPAAGSGAPVVFELRSRNPERAVRRAGAGETPVAQPDQHGFGAHAVSRCNVVDVEVDAPLRVQHLRASSSSPR
jgi:hypothetical protein